MAYVSQNVAYLVSVMNTNPNLFNVILVNGNAELLQMYISQVKLELSSQLMDEDDADTLFLLQLKIQNQLAKIA